MTPRSSLPSLSLSSTVSDRVLVDAAVAGDRTAFVTLDESVTGNVRFGDGSVVQIKGRGDIAFCIDGGPPRALTDV